MLHKLSLPHRLTTKFIKMKMMKMKTWKLLFVMTAFVALASCTNTNKTLTSPQKVSFLLTDAPAWVGFTHVNVDIEGLAYVTADSTITNVSITPGVYDLKSLMNGDSTLLSQIILPNNVSVKQVRLILGSNNTVTLSNGTVVPVTVPSGMQSGIKINIDETVPSSGDYSIMIDFNAERSIIATGNNKYIMKPVLRAYVVEATSSIKGYISPAKLPTKIFVINETDTIATISDTTKNNYFQLSGFTAGTYTVQFLPSDTTMVTNTISATVKYGSDTNLGTVTVK